MVPWVLTHDEWMEKWAPRCPDENHQRLLTILGFRLKGDDYLQLQVVMRKGDNGVCQAISEEHPDRIYVRALSCLSEEADDADWYWTPTRELAWPCNLFLDAPLGERVVIDVDTGEELPLCIPRWGTGEPSLYVRRPPGLLWPPEDMPRAS
jgi:hypothetical protein